MHPFISTLIRPHFLALKGYLSAGMEHDKNAQKIFLNANENPYELPGLEGANRYPEPQPKALIESYAALYNAPAANFIATRGADEAIQIITKLFCAPETDSILICPPTFGVYGVGASAMPAYVAETPLIKKKGTFALNIKNIIKSPAKLIYICNPNNPTGTSFAPQDIASIARKTEGKSIVIIDETYIEFARKTESFTAYLGNHPNIIILRTLSKSYSLAGMRMGCLITADPDLAALIRAKGLDAYPLPKASIEAALHVMAPDIKSIAHTNIEKILSERARMEAALKINPHISTVYASDANFLLIESSRAQELLTACARANIILRDFSQKPDTPNCLRLSIGTAAQNDKLLKILNAL